MIEVNRWIESVFEATAADEFPQDGRRWHRIGVDGDEAVYEVEKTKRGLPRPVLTGNLQQVALSEHFQHGDFVYQRRIEDSVGMMLEWEDVLAFSMPHVFPSRDIVCGAPSAGAAVSNDAANQSDVGGMNPIHSIEWQLCEWTDEYPKRTILSASGQQARIQPVDTLKHQNALRIETKLLPLTWMAGTGLEIVASGSNGLAI